MQKDQIQEAATKAFLEYAMPSVVLVLFGKPRRLPDAMGTGTLVRRASGRTAILTAQHVAGGCDSATLSIAGRVAVDAVEVRFERIEVAPDRVDVALILLDAHDVEADALDPAAIPEVVDAKADDHMFITGFTDQMEVEIAEGKVIEKRRNKLVYFTSLAGADDRYLSLHFREAEYSKDATPIVGLKQQPGERFPLKKPLNISGGPIWKLLPIAKGELWTAERGASLVAVSTQFSNGKQQGERVERWGAWAKGVLSSS